MKPSITMGVGMSGILAASIMAGCAKPSKYFHDYQGLANSDIRRVEQANMLEKERPQEAIAIYKAVVDSSEGFKYTIEHYDKKLRDSLTNFQGGGNSASLSEEAALGIPRIYLRRLKAVVAAHHGLARVSLKEGKTAEAGEHATQALALVRQRGGPFPAFTVSSLKVSYDLLQQADDSQGKPGKALIAKLNLALLEDHQASEGGVSDFYVEKIAIVGEPSQKQYAEVEKFIHGVNVHRMDQNNQAAMALAGGLMMANSAVQSSLASQAMARSGGVMTPQVQMAQMNAQMAQMQVVMFASFAKMDAGQSTGIDLKTSPWAVPTFAQQLVDTKMGVNSRGIVKGFAANAATAGGSATLQQGAQQVIQGVDALPTVQTTRDPQAIVKSVESFAGVFNAFLTQVQEIKSAK